MVEVMSGYGIPQADIARVLNKDLKTVLKHFREELDRGSATVYGTMVGNLFRLSKGSDGTALKATMFTLQTRFGWSQFVPRQVVDQVPRDEPLGKKEAADLRAQTAHEDTDWGDLVH